MSDPVTICVALAALVISAASMMLNVAAIRRQARAFAEQRAMSMLPEGRDL